MDSPSLSSYFDVLHKSALMLTSETETLSSASMAVYYVNSAFLDIIGHSQRDSPTDGTNFVGNKFLSILQSYCISPSISRFARWLDDIIQAPNSVQLKSRFRGLKNTETSFVEIEWNGVVVEGKYVVLTGRTFGTAQFSAVPTVPQLGPRQKVRSPDTIEEEDEGSYIRANAPSVSSADSKTSRIHRKLTREISPTTPTTGLSRMSSLTDDQSTQETYTWRNNEKVCPT